MRKFLLVIITVLLYSVSYAQQLDAEIDSLKLKAWQLKKLGKNAEKVGDWYSAIDYFTKYLEFKPEKIKFKYKLADNYRVSRDYITAKTLYSEVYESNPETFPLAKYWMGVLTKMGEADYEGAKTIFEEFKTDHKPVAKVKPLRKILDNDIAGCDLAPKLIADTIDAKIMHLDTSINKAHMEFAPILLSKDVLVYASLRTDEIKFYSTNPEDSVNVPVRKFYKAEREFEEWVYKGEFEGPFNSDINTGNGAFNVDSSQFYFTRCETNVKGKVICAIWKSEKDSTGEWALPEKLSDVINNPEYTSTQPTMGIDPKNGNDCLYFVSDCDVKSKGGLDLYYAVWDDKREYWKTAKNCGSKINTPGDEMTPHYNFNSKQLYFSSEGWPGLGGQDIFMSVGQLNKWTVPENIGYPINSSVDDIYYTLSKSQEEGFFVSNRSGGVALKNPTCCDDLYYFYLSQYIHIGLNGKLFELLDTATINPLNNMPDSIGLLPLVDDDLLFDDRNTLKKEIVGASVKLFLIDTTSGEKIFINGDTTDQSGEFFMKLEQGNDYQVVISRPGYFNKQIDISTVEITEDDTLDYTKLFLKEIPSNPIVIKNIYYPFDKFFLTDSAMANIDTTIFKIMEENPQIIAEISSHTDSKGSETYNEKLSQRRAESVVVYLITQGIDRNRLVAKGYGESQPIDLNENEDGTDNEEGRAHNRRTEFRVIGTVKNYTDIIYEE